MADDEDLYKGPLAERVQSKNWKVRRAAFEELQQKFKEATDNAIFDEYAPKFKKIIEDKNAAAQEKGLEALLTWIDRAENPTKLNGLCQPLAVNCFGGRSNTVQKAIEALLLFIEVDRSGEAVIAALLPECFSKQWKISSTTISTIALALKTFGHKHVPLKPILKEVAKMFEDSNAKVREEAQKLMIEMYRWAGSALKPTVDTLRPAQAKDLNTAFEALPQAKAVPEKRLRCEQPQDDEEEAPAGRGAGGGGGGGGEDEDEEAGGMDAYELAEPVDILSKLPGDWYDKVASTKWKERNEQMDVLLSLLNTPRLQPGDYRELTKTIKKIIDKDANVTVVMKAAQAAGLLAKGLRQAYSADAKYLVSTLLAKFKEKKANVVTAIHEALDAMMDTCFALPDLAEDLPAAADAKTPPGREQTLAFVLRFIVKSKRASVGQAIKLLGPLLLKAMDDSTPEVREAAYKAFGTLVGKVGERPLSPYLTKLDGIKEKKVKENYPEKIFTGTLNLNPQAAAAKPAAAANGKPAAAAKKPAAATANGKPAAVSATANGAKRPAPAAASSSNKPPAPSQPPKPAAAPKPEPAAAAPAPKPAASAPKPAAAKPKPKPQPAIPVELPLITPEEAMEKATAVLAETTLPLLEDAQWKNRVAGMEELMAQLDKLLEKDDALMVQVILRLVEQKPGFKDANFLVMQKVLHTITRLAKSQFFTKSMAELVLAVLVDKIADIKLRLVALECLNGVVEAVGLDFVLREVYKHATESKNPKAANEVLSWITTAIEDFGIQGPPAPVDVKLLVEFVKTLLEHSNAMVRSSATKAVTKIFTFVGEAIKEHLGDVKPALMTTIEKEFAKYANAKPDPPTKFYRQKEAVVAPIEEEEEEPEPEPVAEEPAAVELVEPAPASVRTTTSAAPSRATSRPAPAAARVDDGWVEGSIDEYDDGQQEENAPPARADVTPLLTPALFAELADPKDWKRRKEALDKIRRILSEANMRVQSGCLALLMPKLNARLKDTNKNLVLYTVKLLGLLATAVGREIEGQMKLTVPLILANYTDQKQTMRDTVAKTLDQWAAEVGPDTFVPFFPAAVAIESSSARKDALAWLVAHKQDLGKKSDVRVLLRPAVAALQDKTKDVRDLAEALLMHLFARVDVESIRAVCKELPQAAVRQQVVALAKKARGSVSASGSSVGSTTSSNDGSEKSVASSASSRSTGSVAPGSVKPPRSSSTTKTTTTDKPSATTTASSSTEVRTRRTSATTAPSSLSRESKPQPTRSEAITPLVANEDKAKRQRQDKDHITVGADDQARGGGGWTFKTAPRPEHAQHLQQQARPYLGEALHAKMFSRDFRKHREALQELTAAVEDHPAATQQNADLLLKWASLRLFDANTSTQAKTLAFVEHLFRALDAHDYQLTDYEAGVILPALLECLGQGEAMQEGIGALLKLVPRVYPSSKFFAFLLHTGLLGSKSPRTRAECLELMAGLVRRQGLAAVCPTPSAAFPQIAQFVTDKVSAVRNAALGLIQQAHLHAGDDLWLYTGSLNDTQRALINQKLGGGAGAGSGSASPLRSSSSGVVQPSAVKKVMQHKEEEKRRSRSSSPSATAHKAKAAATSSSSSSVGSLGSSKTVVGVRTTASSSSRATASRSSRPASDDGSSPGPSSAALQPLPQSFSLELDKLQPVKSTKAPRAAPAALEPTTSAAAAEPTSTAGSSVVIEAWVKELESGDVDKMIGVCKAVLERLAESVTPFVGCSDGLVQTLAGLLNSTLRQKDFSIDRNREFKYFVNVLFKLFTHAPLAIGISRDASKCVLHSLMVAFVDPLVVPRSDTDTANNLYKGIQLATMKVLRNTDQTAIFTTLLEMLDDVLLGAGGESLPKGFAEVLIKALAIAVQHIKETIDEMNLDQVLRDLNAFLEAHHGRAAVDDGDGDSIKAQMRQECVRLCHAAVKEIVAIKGRAGVSRHLSLVPVTKYPTPALVRVINKVLRDTFGAGGEAITAAPEGVRPEQEGEEDVDGHLAAKIELRQIMQRLASSERQQAIKDLYHFKCRHPDIDIQPYLATATTQFQTYVRRALMAVEEKENMPVRPDPANASAPAAASSAGSEDVYMDKLRALQKRYGHTAGNKHGAGASSNTLLSLASSTDSTAASASAASSQLPSLAGTAAKPGLPSTANGASIQDLRLRLNTVLRTAGVAPATPTHHQAPSAADVSTPSPSPSSAFSSDLASPPSYAAMTPVSASAAAASVTSPSSATLDVQALKERLARIKQTAAK